MTYAELKTNIVAYMKRADLTAMVDTFIDMFEARASRILRAPEMEQTAIVTPVAETQALPVGWVEFRNVQYNGAGYTKPLEYASPQKISATGLTGGDPAYYSIKGGAVVFSPSAIGSTIEWTFFEAIPALSSLNTSNWLLAKYPDYYLMGCVQQAHLYVMSGEDARIEPFLQNIEHQINKAAKTAMSGPITIVSA